MNEVLQKVRDFADDAHGEQRRKYTPEKYIVHPVRVMEICKRFTNDVPVLAAALLHDALEDTDVDKKSLNNFLQTIMKEKEAERTTQPVIELTDVFVKDDYPAWNRRKRKAKETERLITTGAAAQTIKYADIIDNGKEMVTHDSDFASVFLRERKSLLKQMNKGNEQLCKEAVETVNKALQQLKHQKG